MERVAAHAKLGRQSRDQVSVRAMFDMRRGKPRACGFAPAVLAVLVGLGGVLLAVSEPGRKLEQQVGLGWLYALRGPVPAPPDVVLVAMDRRSSDRLGLPASYSEWPRTVHAQLVDRLVRDGAAVIVYDVFFKNPRSTAEDSALARAIRASRRTVLVQATERLAVAGDTSRATTVAQTVRSPAASLADGARGYGPYPLPRVPARVDQFWSFLGQRPTLPVVALQLAALRDRAAFRRAVAALGPKAGAALDAYRASPHGPADLLVFMEAMRGASGGSAAPETAAVGDAPEAGRQLAALLRAYRGPDSYFANFYGPPGAIRTIPYAAAFGPQADLDLTGKIVLVGAAELSMPNATDGFDTVYSRRDGVELSGVEIAATAIANLLDDNVIRRLGTGETALLVLAFGVLVTVAASWGRSVLSLVGAVLVGAAYLAAARYAFALQATWLPLTATVLVQLPAALLLGATLSYVQARRDGEKVLTGLRTFLPEHATALLKSGRKPEPTSQIVHGVCMFTDLEGYTAATESLSLHDLAPSNSAYFRLVSEAIAAYGGTVIGYAGDGVIGTWDAGTFTDRREMRRMACLAALDTRRRLESYSFDPHRARLKARIGLHEGDFLSGFFGGDLLLDHAVLGDTVNTASRIEALNKHLGTQILMSDRLTERLDGILYRRLGRFRVAGKSEVLSICEILAGADACSGEQRALCDRFAAVVDAFDSERWEEAAREAEQVLRAYPDDGPARLLLDMANQRLAAQSVDSGPVIVMEHK